MRMQDLGEVRTQRRRDPGETRTDTHAAPGLRLGDEILGGGRRHDALDRRAGKTDLTRDLTETEPIRLAFERAQHAGRARDDLHAEAYAFLVLIRHPHVHHESPTSCCRTKP